MPRANVVIKLNYNPVIDVLSKIEGSIKDVIKNGSVQEATSLLVATELSKTITEKYHVYLGKIANYEHEKSDIVISVTNTKKGWVVHASGDDLLYHEYGTGTRGLQNPHPNHAKDGMKPYGSGQNIVHNGIKNNGGNTPYWYKLYRDFPGFASSMVTRDLRNDFEDGNIRASDYVWRHNYTITKGLPAGRFIYDSIEEIANYDVSGSHTTLKHTMTQTIRKEFVRRLNAKYEKLKNK